MTDRELDALVAEKVFGELIWPATEARNVGIKRGKFHWDPLPAYSTDIAAAWEVVEKLTDYPSYMDIQITYTASNGWFIEFSKGETSFSSCNQDDELTRAVCLAALKALGVKMEE